MSPPVSPPARPRGKPAAATSWCGSPGPPRDEGYRGTGKEKHPRNSGRTPRGKRKIIIKNNKEHFAFLEHAEFNPIYNSGVELG